MDTTYPPCPHSACLHIRVEAFDRGGPSTNQRTWHDDIESARTAAADVTADGLIAHIWSTDAHDARSPAVDEWWDPA